MNEFHLAIISTKRPGNGPGRVSLDYKAIERRIKGQEPTSLF